MAKELKKKKTFKDMKGKLGDDVSTKRDSSSNNSKHSGVSKSTEGNGQIDRKYSIIARDLTIEVFEKNYQRLKDGLELGIHKFSFGKLAEAVDKASENARIAHNLHVAAKEELQKYEEITYAIWWAKRAKEAMEAIALLKKQDKFSGQIGEEKIKNWIIDTYGSEYQEYHGRLIKLRAVESTLKGLAEQWESRKSLLQTQGKLTEKRVVVGKD